MSDKAEGSHPLLQELSGEQRPSLLQPLVAVPPAGTLHRLKTTPQPIRDGHPHLIPFCESLELVFRHGLKRKALSLYIYI